MTQRYDGYDAMAYHNIYRDPWERKLPSEKNYSAVRMNTLDYPELQSTFDEVTQGPFLTIHRDDIFMAGPVPGGHVPEASKPDSDDSSSRKRSTDRQGREG